MRMEQLDKDARLKIYQEHMLQDFHAEEIKPFTRMEELLAQGRYRCCGCYDGKMLIGYMYFAKSPNTEGYLLDYYSIFPAYRSKGYGGKMLSELRKQGTLLLAEVEDPAYPENEGDRALRERRIGFYKRNGLRPLALRSQVLGAHYIIMLLEPADRPPMTEKEAAEAMADIYKVIFGEEFFEKHIVLEARA